MRVRAVHGRRGDAPADRAGRSRRCRPAQWRALRRQQCRRATRAGRSWVPTRSARSARTHRHDAPRSRSRSRDGSDRRCRSRLTRADQVIDAFSVFTSRNNRLANAAMSAHTGCCLRQALEKVDPVAYRKGRGAGFCAVRGELRSRRSTRRRADRSTAVLTRLPTSQRPRSTAFARVGRSCVRRRAKALALASA
jgi:hypothetical protein